MSTGDNTDTMEVLASNAKIQEIRGVTVQEDKIKQIQWRYSGIIQEYKR